MNIVFIVLAIIMVIYVVTRKIDMFSIAIVCLLIYNIHCAVGFVYIASHERVNVNYYAGFIRPEVYIVVIAQMIILFGVTIYNDHLRSPEKINRYLEYPNKYSQSELDFNFMICGVISLVILIINVARIGLSGLSADKGLVWEQTDLLYITGQWLAMSVFAYGIKQRVKTFVVIGIIPVLVHLFIGSRAYFAVVAIVFLLYYGARLKDTFRKNLKVYILGFIALFVIMIYKKIFELVKAFDIEGIQQVLKDPDTYMWFFRWGEPRIVLANFNYIVERHIKLDTQAILNRIVVFIPFLDDVIGGGNRLMSDIVISNLNSSYGLASNIWGEFWAIGSFPLIFIMYLVWIKLLFIANDRIWSDSWTSFFLLPLISYYGYYIHRMDFIKVVGNAKMVLFSAIIWWLIASLNRGEFRLTICYSED